MFSVRLVKADHYMSNPITGLDVRYSDFRGFEVKQVPVIRIFGSTDSGQKVCLHIHGVFPYFYIPYDGCIEKEKFVYQIASGIDKALNVSLGNSNSQTQHVYKVTVVSAIPLYGFHSKAHQFLKIYFYNPLMIKRASDLLQNGVILGQVFQPHEAHIPFMLQFFMDYNLHGMSFVNLASVRYRQGPIDGSDFKAPPLDNVPQELLLPDNILRVSTCKLEVDAVAADILNQQEISAQLTSNPGLRAIWDEEKERRRNENLNSQFTPQSSQVREASSTASERFHLERLKKRLHEASLLNENVNPGMEKSPSDGKQKPYPAPTPEGVNCLEASFLFSHVDSLCCDNDLNKSGGEKTFKNVHIKQGNMGENETLSSPVDSEPNSSQFSTLNSQCLSLVHILQDLIEDDSVLGSQLQGNDEENERPSDNEDEILSQSLDCKDLQRENSSINTLRNYSDNDEEHNPQNPFCVSQEKSVIASSNVFKSALYKTETAIDNSPNCDKHLYISQPETKMDESACSLSCKSNSSGEMNIPENKDNCSMETVLSPIDISDNEKLDEFDNCVHDERSECVRGTSKSDNGVYFSQKSAVAFNPLTFSKGSPALDCLPAESSLNCISGRIEECTNWSVICVPKKGPPTRKEVLKSLSLFNLPQHEFLKPFFSNVSDIVKRKEVGKKDLKILSHSVKELELFETTIPELKGLTVHKDEAVRNLWEQSLISHTNVESIFKEGHMKEALAGLRETILTPSLCAPSVKDVKLWAKARASYKKKSVKTINEWKNETNLVPHILNRDQHIELILPVLFSEKKSLSENFPALTDSSQSMPQHSSEKLILTNVCTQSNTILLRNDNCQENKTIQISKNFKSLVSTDAVSDSSESNTYLPKVSGCNTVDNLLVQSQFRQQLVTPEEGKASTSHETLGFKMSYENLQDCRAVIEPQYLTLLTIELHIQTRGDLRPDPAHDPVCAAFYCIQNDVPEESLVPNFISGMVVVQDSNSSKYNFFTHGIEINCKISYVTDERALMEEIVDLVLLWDPDILAGYEVEMLSWGYLFERAFVLELNLCPLVSRIPGARHGNKSKNALDETAVELEEEFSLLGRIVLNVWRLMRHEVALQSYTFENVSFHVLHERIPLVSFKTLTQWWGHRTRYYCGRVADHYLLRVRGIMRILEQLDLINRTSELARIFGIQFYEVLSRGSQFRVESMMLRLAKPLNYIPVSPSVQQRARMRAPEYLQLIMEPESQLYVDPVIVLDFQSLYPSIIIAYNYCFSTCLGRIEHLGQSSPFEFGSSHLRVPPDEIKHNLTNLNISPGGVVFVDTSVRKGILPRMLEEILETRLMVKKSMKEHKDNKTLQRVLHSRQLGLKLIANVTYGYTAANFSGRMSCVEIADSVVSKGRETLERAIYLVENTSQWGARVVYGDTDSLFVLVSGRSREEAFVIGAEIAEAVTQSNPSPVKLKLEKVYQPCILQTKKRYVGYMYESSNQKEPVYDAKGIETVRRDGCPAVAKVLEKSLRVLFETKDISKVKSYVQRKFSLLLEGQMSIQDLTFAREYRGRGGYKPGACVPALELTKKWLSVDPRSEPRVSERVPYIIVSGAPNVPLIQLVKSPHELLTEPTLRVHAHYYVSRVLCPPLARCFSLLGADVLSWYTDLPRRTVLSLPKSFQNKEQKKFTISQYFSTSNCPVCHQICQLGICSECQSKPQNSAVILAEKLHEWERHYYSLEKICQSCCGYFDKIECISLDCPVMYHRNHAKYTMLQESFIQTLQKKLANPMTL